jgi:hypothetical protein
MPTPSRRRLLLSTSQQRYLLRDLFTTARAAGAVNGTVCEPGGTLGGTRAAADVSGTKVLISGGRWTVTGSGVWGEHGIRLEPAVTRVKGRVIIQLVRAQSSFDTAMFGPTTAADANFNGYANLGWTTASGSAIAARRTSSVTSPNLFAAVAATDYQFLQVLLDVGRYMFVKGGVYTFWTPLWRDTWSNAASMYLGIAVNASITYEGDDWRVPDRLWLPTPLAYDSFTRTNGALGSTEAQGPDGQASPVHAWTGPTWAIVSDAAVNTPSLSAELLTDGGFESWASPTNANNTTESVAGTSTINQDGANARSGSFALRMDVDASNSLVYFEKAVPTVIGRWYQLQVWAKGNGVATAGFHRGSGSSTGQVPFTPTASYQLYSASFRATATGTFAWGAKRISAASASLYFDDFSVKELVLSELFKTVPVGTPDVFIDVVVKTLVQGTSAGICARINDAANPTSGLIAYFTDGGRIKLDEFTAAGTWTNLLDASQGFTAGDLLRLHLRGSTWRLFHMTAANAATMLGTGTTTVLTGNMAGGFSTDPGNAIETFFALAMGTVNEHAALDAL